MRPCKPAETVAHCYQCVAVLPLDKEYYMFYAMQQIKDEYNPKLWHIRAIRTKSFKLLSTAKKVAGKVSTRNVKGFVIDQHRNIVP